MFCWTNIIVLVNMFALVHSSPDDDTFSSYVGFNNVATMPYPLSDMTAVVFKKNERIPAPNGVEIEYQIVPEDRVYLFGGCTSDQTCTVDKTDPYLPRTCYCQSITNKCTYYIPGTNKWKMCAPAPTERYRHAWAKVDGKVYLIGGRDVADSIITKIDIYDPRTDTWDQTGMTWVNATSDAVAWGWGSDIYYVGGYEANYTALSGLTRINTISKKVYTNLPSMKYPRGDTQVQQVGTTFFVMGGFNGWGFNAVTKSCALPTQYNEAFDATKGVWLDNPAMLYARGDLAMGTDGKELIFSIAGETVSPGDQSCSHQVPVADVGRYNLTSKKWAVEGSIPANRFRFTGASYFNGSFHGIYLFGGQTTYDAKCGCPTGVTFGCGDGCYRLSDITTLYVPVTIYNRRKKPEVLTPGAIAGVVISVIVVVVVCGMGIAAVISRYAYRYMYVHELDNIAAEQPYNIDDPAHNPGPAVKGKGQSPGQGQIQGQVLSGV